MKREEVFDRVSDEMDYQLSQEPNPDSHIVSDFPLAAAMEAIRYNLEKANKAWYNSQAPYEEAMDSIRKIAAISIKMGEQYGMPERKF